MNGFCLSINDTRIATRLGCIWPPSLVGHIVIFGDIASPIPTLLLPWDAGRFVNTVEY